MLDQKAGGKSCTIHRLNETEKITIVHITHHMDEVINADR